MAPRIYVGRFDPRFPGVSIRATGDSDVHSFRHHDRSRSAPVEVFTGLGDDAVISDVSRQTVLDHELRHFRDSLLFPFGAATTRSRIHASYNGFLAAMTLVRMRGDADVLPVPLQTWLRMPAPERDAFLSDEAAFAGNQLRPPPLPVIPGDDDLSDLAGAEIRAESDEELLIGSCRTALADYRMLEDLWRSPHEDGEQLVSPAVDIWETAGLLCQLAAIARYAGEPVMQRFVDWVVRRGPHPYRRGMQVLAVCLEQLAWPATLRNQLALATWAQMGRYETERSASSPGRRLVALVSAAARGARWSEGSAFADLVHAWDEVAGVDSVAGLHAATVRFGAFCRRTRMTSLLPTELFTSLADAREQMLAAFLDDPDAYVDPFAYLTDDDRYPLPCVGMEHPTGALGSDWSDVTPPTWAPAVSYDAAMSLASIALLSDAVFLPGEKSLQRNGRVAIASALDLRAVRIIR